MEIQSGTVTFDLTLAVLIRVKTLQALILCLLRVIGTDRRHSL